MSSIKFANNIQGLVLFCVW